MYTYPKTLLTSFEHKARSRVFYERINKFKLPAPQCSRRVLINFFSLVLSDEPFYYTFIRLYYSNRRAHGFGYVSESYETQLS